MYIVNMYLFIQQNSFGVKIKHKQQSLAEYKDIMLKLYFLT